MLLKKVMLCNVMLIIELYQMGWCSVEKMKSLIAVSSTQEQGVFGKYIDTINENGADKKVNIDNSTIEDLGEDLRSFFIDYILKDEKDIVILITKKSFWSFSLLCEQEQEERNVQVNRYYSDRYFSKLLDFSSFDGKSILIVDDTLNHGVAVRQFCDLMKMNCPNSEISVAVCYKNEKIEPEGFNEYKEENLLFVKEAVSPQKIGCMCVYETLQFHENLVPYIVDLPILTTNKNGIRSRKIRMSTQKFRDICKGNAVWTYHSANYELIPGKGISAGFFELYSMPIKKIFGAFLFNLTLKVQYIFDEEKDEIEAVFTPFAMMRSVNTDELKACFNILFMDTPYKDYINSVNLTETLISNYYTALYRSVVYYLSMYIGVKFIRYIQCDENLELYNDNQFEESFYKSIDILFPKQNNYQNFHEINFLSRILLINEFSEIKDFCEEEAYVDGLKTIDYSYEDWFAFLYEQIIIAKRKNSEKKYFTSETFEKKLFNKYNFSETNYDDFSVTVTRIINEALNKSVLSNFLVLGNHNKVLYRGYRYGENSEHLLPYDARIFYQGISVYYDRVREKYFEKVDYFCYLFKEFLQKNGYYNNLISERQFLFFVRYFTKLSSQEILTQIENKKYLLEKEYCEQSDLIREVLYKVEDFALKVELIGGE